MNWDEYFISIADVVRNKSKDPSSKVGAVVVGLHNQIVSTGYNGFPRGIVQTVIARWGRPVKYSFVVHAEANAVYNAARTGVSLVGCTLYLFGFTVPCTECSKAIIQSGIVRVVSKAYRGDPEWWTDDLILSKALLLEAGVEVVAL